MDKIVLSILLAIFSSAVQTGQFRLRGVKVFMSYPLYSGSFSIFHLLY
jgi:hypothetical protein